MPFPSRKRVHSRLREARSKRKKSKKKPTDDESSSESNAVHITKTRKSLTEIIGEHDSDDSSDRNTAVVVHGIHDSVHKKEVLQVNKKRSIRDIIGDSDSSTDSDSSSESNAVHITKPRSKSYHQLSPREKASIHHVPAEKVAGRRRVTGSIIQKHMVARRLAVQTNTTEESYSSESVSGIKRSRSLSFDDLSIEIESTENATHAATSQPRRSGRKQVHTEKYLSYVEDSRRASKTSCSLQSQCQADPTVDRVPYSERSSYKEQRVVDRKRQRTAERERKLEQLEIEEHSTNHRQRNKIKGLFTTLEGVWNNECKHCGYIHLDCATPHMLSNCCYNGKLSPWNDNDEFFMRYSYLSPLSEHVTNHILNNMENIGRLSAAYNTALGICRIGCENGNRETGARNTHEGGFEIRRGDSAFAISGRLYHSMAKYVSSTDPAGK